MPPYNNKTRKFIQNYSFECAGETFACRKLTPFKTVQLDMLPFHVQGNAFPRQVIQKGNFLTCKPRRCSSGRFSTKGFFCKENASYF